MMPMPLRSGTRIVTQPDFDPEGFLALIQEKRPDAVQAVPAMLRLIVDCPRAADYDVSSLRWIFTGTAPLTLEAYFRAFPELLSPLRLTK